MNRPTRRHDSVQEGLWMAALLAGIVAWLYFKAPPESPIVSKWWQIYEGTFVKWFPAWCRQTLAASAVTLGLVLTVPLMFATIRLSERLYISSLRSQKRRAQRLSALVEGRPPPVAGPSATVKAKASAIERAHQILRREKRKP